MSAYDKTSIQINRCKRILALVDDYVEKQDAATRTDLRKTLMEEFEAPSIAQPVAAGSVDKEEVAGFAMAVLEEGQEWMRRAEKAEAELDTLKESLRLVNVDHGLWMARTHAAEDARDDALTRVKELETERQALQAEGKHPAPCARHCEANAYQIEVRRLVAVELDMHRKLAAEVLRADQGWARYEAANRAKNALEVTLAAR